MSIGSVVAMVLILGGVWGGFLALLVKAARSEGGEDDEGP